MQKIDEVWGMDMRQNAEEQVQQFLDLWFYVIRKPSFQIIMPDWEKFSKNLTEAQLLIYAQIIQMTKKYWNDMQDKNIE